MLFTLLNLCYQFSLWAGLIALLTAGLLFLVGVFLTIFLLFASSANKLWLKLELWYDPLAPWFLIVSTVAIIFLAIAAILHLLIGGDTHAL